MKWRYDLPDRIKIIIINILNEVRKTMLVQGGNSNRDKYKIIQKY